MKAKHTRADVDSFIELFQWSKDKLQPFCNIAVIRDWTFQLQEACFVVATFPASPENSMVIPYEETGAPAIANKTFLIHVVGLLGMFIKEEFQEKFYDRVERDIKPIL